MRPNRYSIPKPALAWIRMPVPLHRPRQEFQLHTPGCPDDWRAAPVGSRSPRSDRIVTERGVDLTDRCDR
jgi:hypothetical protein